MKNWETERIANMNLIIMQVALAEIMTFPSIPINVTFNEYIDTAKILQHLKVACSSMESWIPLYPS